MNWVAQYNCEVFIAIEVAMSCYGTPRCGSVHQNFGQGPLRQLERRYSLVTVICTIFADVNWRYLVLILAPSYLITLLH
jgi:hypothetical protein